MLKCLFICKKREDGYGGAGLINSARFVVNTLNSEYIASAKVVSVNDNNDIDRELTLFKPDYCFIEALWVVPEKFMELAQLHPTVEFVIRVHSKMPFLAMEGMAIEWIRTYNSLSSFMNITIAPNSISLSRDLDTLGIRNQYLPNIYRITTNYDRCYFNDFFGRIHIGCFGAIRAFKNHLTQAVAAIEFTEKHDKELHFHINVGRLEMEKANDVLKNLRALFFACKHQLIEHPWMPHTDFLGLVRCMDIGMQVSFSESFNIVSADFVNCYRPIVVSNDVTWMPKALQANPNSTKDIVEKLEAAYYPSWLSNPTRKSAKALNNHNQVAIGVWKHYLTGENV